MCELIVVHVKKFTGMSDERAAVFLMNTLH